MTRYKPDFDVKSKVEEFIKDLDNFESFMDCLDYYIEKDPILNDCAYPRDRKEDFVDELANVDSIKCILEMELGDGVQELY